MGFVKTAIKTNSALDILKAIKGLFKTGWTLDEENIVLWKDTPAAFPVGICYDTYTSSSTSKYIQPCVKNAAGETKRPMENLLLVSSTAAEYYIGVYTSPGGSIFVDVSTETVNTPSGLFGFIKNTAADPALPSYLPVYYKNGETSMGCQTPGTDAKCSVPAADYLPLGLNYALCNAVDPYTGTAFTDLYFLAAKPSSEPPLILTNGNYKFVRFRRYNSNSRAFYLRYV